MKILLGLILITVGLNVFSLNFVDFEFLKNEGDNQSIFHFFACWIPVVLVACGIDKVRKELSPTPECTN